MSELWDFQQLLTVNYPVCQIKIYGGGIEVIRKQRVKLQGQPPPRDSRVTRLSQSSLSRLAFLVNTTDVKFASILTLTYSEIPVDGKVVKKHLNLFLTKLRYHFDVSYVWFLEFQRRGAPHFHLLLSRPVSHQKEREVVADLWAKIISDGAEDYRKIRAVHEHKRAWENIRKEDGAKRYALKYAMKLEQKTVPKRYKNVGRFWGNSRDVKTDDYQVVDITEDELREWIDAHEPAINERLPEFLPRYIFRSQTKAGQNLDKT